MLAIIMADRLHIPHQELLLTRTRVLDLLSISNFTNIALHCLYCTIYRTFSRETHKMHGLPTVKYTIIKFSIWFNYIFSVCTISSNNFGNRGRMMSTVQTKRHSMRRTTQLRLVHIARPVFTKLLRWIPKIP